MESHDNHRSGPDRIVSHSEAGSHPPRMTPPLSPSVYRQFPRPSSPRLHGFAFLSPLNLVSVLVSVPPRFATSRHASARLNPLPETTARSPSLNSIRTEFIRPRGGRGSRRARPPGRGSEDLAPSTSRLTGIRLKWCNPYTAFPPEGGAALTLPSRLAGQSKLPHSRCQR